MSTETNDREAFEARFTRPPYEFDMSRWPENSTQTAWPGDYRSYDVECAWAGWQARAALSTHPAAVQPTPCAGMSCGTTTAQHSPECIAEHAAAVAGGRFVKVPEGMALVPREQLELLMADYNAYVDGKALMPWGTFRISLAAFFEAAALRGGGNG